MNNYTDNLVDDYIPGLTYNENGEILVLVYDAFLRELANNSPKIISTPALLDFVKTLGKNKSGGKNGISRLQFFINAYLQEMTLVKVNPGILKFLGDNHDYLARGETGDDKPDLLLSVEEGDFGVEAKKYWNKVSYKDNLPTANFHNADYVLVYLIEGGWRVSLKTENYEILHFITDLATTDPWLLQITLPTKLGSIKFYVDKDALDQDVPEEVGYSLYL